jgi:hypothetical protein
MKTPRNRKQSSTRRNFKIIKQTEYLNKLKSLYPLCKHDSNKIDEKNSYADHKITYGEMTYEGIELLYQYVLKNCFQILPHCFIDIGSGRGKLCLYMAEKNNIEQTIGIELVKSRYDDAIKLKEDLNFESYTRKVKFYNSNIFDLSLRKIIYTSPVFIWFSNLCFESSTTDSIFNKIVSELPIGSIICCSKTPTNIINCTLINTIIIPMSWSNNSNVYIYQTC